MTTETPSDIQDIEKLVTDYAMAVDLNLDRVGTRKALMSAISRVVHENKALKEQVSAILAAWLVYKNRGVAPAPNQYQSLAAVLNAALQNNPFTVLEAQRFDNAPCFLCGYNGPNYYQPNTHGCAIRYHAHHKAALAEVGQMEGKL